MKIRHVMFMYISLENMQLAGRYSGSRYPLFLTIAGIHRIGLPGKGEGKGVLGGTVGFAARLGQYFKRPDIRKELTRYARILSSRKTTLSSAGQAGVAAHPLNRMGDRGAPEESRRRPSCCLCNRRHTRARRTAPASIARPIGAFNRQQPANVEKRINL